MFTFDLEQGVVVFTLSGYVDAGVGKALQERCAALFKEGHLRFVLDFAQTTVVNSPGLGAVLDLGFRVKDDYRGRLVLTGLDAIKQEVFEVVGVLPMLPLAATRQAAVDLARR